MVSSEKSRSRRMSVTEVRYWKTLPKRTCQYLIRKVWFWIAVAFFALIEPILCAHERTELFISLQYIALAISSALYIVQIVGVATTEWDKIQAVKALGTFGSVFVPKTQSQLTIIKLLKFFTAEGEFMVEGLMLLAGWILIGWHPGLAILRCFRVFRLLWFYEVAVFKSSMMKWFGPIFGEGFVTRGFKVLKFAIKALSALGDEIFRLTPETRGGLLLIMMIFFSAWVLGAALYVETKGEAENCGSIGLCTYSLMRLTFFDGNGLDLAYSLVSKHKILFFICMLYMCITAFGIINGLIGIFGTLFSTASTKAFEEDDDDEREYAKEVNPDEDDLESIPEEDNEEGAAEIAPEPEGLEAQKSPDAPAVGKFSTEQQHSASNLMKSVTGEAPPLSEIEMKATIKEAMGTTNVSRLALLEFQTEQTKNSPRPDDRPGTGTKYRDRRGRTTPSGTNIYESELDMIPSADVKRQKPTGGMFNKAPRPSSAVRMEGSATDLHIKHLVSQMNNITNKVEQENELIVSMLNQMAAMSKQIAALSAAVGAVDALPPLSSPGIVKSAPKVIQVHKSNFPTEYPPSNNDSKTNAPSTVNNSEGNQPSSEAATKNIDRLLDSFK